MTKLSKFDIEFFEITNLLKNNINKEVILKKLLKLNNPNYYNKFTFKNPQNKLGYPNSKVNNPILVAINNMIQILKKDYPKDDLQKEISWAYHKYSKIYHYYI